MAKLILI